MPINIDNLRIKLINKRIINIDALTIMIIWTKFAISFKVFRQILNNILFQIKSIQKKDNNKVVIFSNIQTNLLNLLEIFDNISP